MAVMMAVPAMTMVVPVADIYNHLCTRRWYQRCKERQSENAQRKLLHT
jgi:hypothetical protein